MNKKILLNFPKSICMIKCNIIKDNNNRRAYLTTANQVLSEIYLEILWILSGLSFKKKPTSLKRTLLFSVLPLKFSDLLI